MPFDRLIRAVDCWAAARGRLDVFAQIGTTEFRPSHIEFAPMLQPDEFRAKVRDSSVLVAHAGMGSILTALEAGKPILVMPRRGDLMETRNDHQVATATQFRSLGHVAVAMDENELPAHLDRLGSLAAGAPISKAASPRLLSAVRAFINGDTIQKPVNPFP